MNFTVILLRAASGFLWAVIPPTPVGIVAQFADQMQVKFPYPIDKIGFTVVAIGQHINERRRAKRKHPVADALNTHPYGFL